MRIGYLFGSKQLFDITKLKTVLNVPSFLGTLKTLLSDCKENDIFFINVLISIFYFYNIKILYFIIYFIFYLYKRNILIKIYIYIRIYYNILKFKFYDYIKFTFSCYN